MQAPSYIADLFLIKIPKNIAENIFLKNQNNDYELDFSNARCTSYFIHEWLHYVHNISTLNGIYAFASLINLWANFRNKIDSQGISIDENKLSAEASAAVIRTHLYRMNSRRARDNPSILCSNQPNAKIATAHANSIEISKGTNKNFVEKHTIIQCRIELYKSGPETTAEIGVIEILEGLASLLEERFLVIHGELPIPANTAPYKLTSMLARHLTPDIDNNQIIACSIASLQCEDPPLALIEMLGAMTNIPPHERLTRLENLAKTRLNEYAELLEDLFIQTTKIFPLSEPMGDSVKNIIEKMREKVQLRIKIPFFELHMLEQVKSLKAEERDERMKRIIAEFSCPRILPTFSEEEKIGRDNILNFGNRELITDEFQFGQQKLHAALHFLWLHLSEDGFLSTEKTPDASIRRCCPFFSMCVHKTRKEHPSICAEKPWETLAIPMPPTRACWYRAGVRATRGPQKVRSPYRQLTADQPYSKPPHLRWLLESHLLKLKS